MNFIQGDNRIFLNNESGDMIAEVTFITLPNGNIEINHTFVDNSLRGQGIASKLMEMAANYIRNENKKAVPTCSYAVKWFEENIDYSDII